MWPDQKFPLFGAGRSQVSAAVVVDAVVGRRVASTTVHFVRVVDVNFLVVHVHRTSTKHSVTIVRVTNGQTALGTRDNGNACLLHADIVLVARAEGCRWQLLPSAGAMRTIDFVARRDALTYPPRVYAAIDTFTCNDLRPSVRRFLSKSNERHSAPIVLRLL